MIDHGHIPTGNKYSMCATHPASVWMGSVVLFKADPLRLKPMAYLLVEKS